MIKSTFILGAGASRSAGGPLMMDFIEKAEQILVDGEAGWAKNYFMDVFEARCKVQAAYAKSHVEIDNVEDLFSTFEMARLIQQLADMNGKHTAELPTKLRYLIMRTIEKSIRFILYEDDPIVGSPSGYDAFVEMLLQMKSSPELWPIAIISFNYDLALDYALTRRGIHIDYGISPPAQDKSRSKKNTVYLLKPHGSLNWSFDETNNCIQITPVILLQSDSYKRRLGVYRPARRPIDTMELLYGPDEWGERPLPEPLIVPPSWSKGPFQERLRTIWQMASKALSSTNNIFIMGYSLPPSDQFFRAFFALSTISESIINRFWLFDPSDIEQRYTSLVGPAILRRNKFLHEKKNFIESIFFISDHFGFPMEPIKQFVNKNNKIPLIE